MEYDGCVVDFDFGNVGFWNLIVILIFWKYDLNIWKLFLSLLGKLFEKYYLLVLK